MQVTDEMIEAASITIHQETDEPMWSAVVIAKAALRAALSVAPTEDWGYGKLYYDEGGNPYIRKVSKAEFDARTPSGHRADGAPYWNYERMRRRPAGEWLPAPDTERNEK